jgi:hypothetical protein
MSALNTANSYDIQLCSALAAANGASVYPSGSSSSGQGNPGIFQLAVWGTVSGTAKMQISPDNGSTWLDYPGATFTAAGVFAPVYVGAQQAVRMTNSAGSVNATLTPIL